MESNYNSKRKHCRGDLFRIILASSLIVSLFEHLPPGLTPAREIRKFAYKLTYTSFNVIFTDRHRVSRIEE
jgi:hypothetical protein